MLVPAGNRGHMGNGHAAANDRFNSQQQQAMMAAVAAATGMRTALFGAAAAAAAAAAAGQPGGAINGIFGGKARHNSIEKPAPNRSRLLEDFRQDYMRLNDPTFGGGIRRNHGVGTRLVVCYIQDEHKLLMGIFTFHLSSLPVVFPFTYSPEGNYFVVYQKGNKNYTTTVQYNTT